MVTVEQLYKDYGVLADAGEKAKEHEAEYQSILSAVSAGPSEKKLAAQFIPRFFQFFPDLAEAAINAQLDLCEDDDCMIRRASIKELPNLCKENALHLLRIADVLTQLLQSDDPQEVIVVNNALMSLFKFDMKGTLGGIFSQILSGDDIVREQAIKFLNNRLKLGSIQPLPKDVEEFAVEKTKEVLADVTGEEFVIFMQLLSKMPIMQTLTGRQQMLDLVVEQADMDAPFNPQEPDCVDRLIQCVREALQYVSRNVAPTKFVVYMCDNVLPVLGDIVSPGTDPKATAGVISKATEGIDSMATEGVDSKATEGVDSKATEGVDSKATEGVVSKATEGVDFKATEGVVSKATEGVVSKATEGVVSKATGGTAGYDVKLEILRQLAEMSTHSMDVGSDLILGKAFDKFVEYMPLPPAETDLEELQENVKVLEGPKLQFSYVECLMYIFYQLGKKRPEFLSADDNADRLKDFRIRLQYFARGTQLYMKQLRLALQGKSGEEMKKEENKLKLVALRVTTNINTLIKDLFRNPPSYKSAIVLSWRPIAKPATSPERPALGQKRSNITPITFDAEPSPVKKPTAATGSAKRSHVPRVMYQPPSGKYSTKAGTAPSDPDYNEGQRNNQWRGGRGRGRGQGRGQGGGKWRY